MLERSRLSIDLARRALWRVKLTQNANGTAALSKGIKLLSAIAEAPNKLTVRELSEVVALPRPTVYRLLAALVEEGLVQPSASGHTYQLGNTLVTIAHRALEQTDIRDV